MKLTLGRKLGLGFGVVLALMTVNLVLSYVKLSEVKQRQEFLLNVRTPSVAACKDLQRDLNQTLNKGRQAILAGTEPARRQAAMQLFEAAWSDADKDIAHLDELAIHWTHQENRDRLAQVKTQVPTLRQIEQAVMESEGNHGRNAVAKAGNNFSDKATVVNEAIKKTLGDLVDSQAKLLTEEEEQLNAASRSLNLTMGIATVAALCIGAFVAIFLSRRISVSIQALSAQAEAIAAGDLTCDDLVVNSSDELGDLIRSVNKMSANLKSTMHAMSRTQSMVENAPVNVISADRDLKIQYMNPASAKTLQTLEKYLPIKVSQMIGQSIDIFHKNPAHQRQLLASDKNLPHRAQIQVGPETLDLLVSAIYDKDKNYIGPMVTWEVITEKLKTENKMAQIQSMMENAPVNVIFADRDLKIQYMNPASSKTLQTLERYMPIKVSQMMGNSIDVFHKNPAHQRQLLANDNNLPHRAQIQVGPETLDLLVSAIYDKDKNYTGPMVTWEVITEKLAGERKIQEAAEREKKQMEELKELFTQVGQTAASLSSSSEELTLVSQQMSANAEETSAQANTVAGATQQVSQNLHSVATGAEEMSATVQSIATNATEAAKIAGEAVKSAQSTNATVQKLGESSAEIGQVIKVITSIAQQTNLLALNATIEAARAGEAGKGFAVVANEVKELAKQTAKATEDISQKITAIQEDTKRAVASIASITGVIGQINDISGTIATAVEEQSATTNEMSRNVTEAAKGSGDISQNIQGVAEAAESTTRGAQDAQKAAKNLSEMSTQLTTLIERFKLDAGDAGEKAAAKSKELVKGRAARATA